MLESDLEERVFVDGGCCYSDLGGVVVEDGGCCISCGVWRING